MRAMQAARHRTNSMGFFHLCLSVFICGYSSFLSAAEPVSFRRDVMAALSISGCNTGSCHGLPSGRGGFRLSLWGQDPAADHVQLTRDVFGRRTSRLDPDASLILQKALGRLPHEGGKRFAVDSLAHRILRTWLAEGLRDDPSDPPALKSIVVSPSPVVLHAPARQKQLAVRADFADGTT